MTSCLMFISMLKFVAFFCLNHLVFAELLRGPPSSDSKTLTAKYEVEEKFSNTQRNLFFAKNNQQVGETKSENREESNLKVSSEFVEKSSLQISRNLDTSTIVLPAPGKGGSRRAPGKFYVCPASKGSGFVNIPGCNNNKGQGVGNPNDEVCPYGTAGFIYCFKVAASDRTAEQWKVLATKGAGFLHGNNFKDEILPAPGKGGSRRAPGKFYVCPASTGSGFVNIPGCNNNKGQGVGNPNDEVCPYGTAGFIYCFKVAASDRTAEQWKVLATKGAGFLHGKKFKDEILPAPGKDGSRKKAGVWYKCPKSKRSGFVNIPGCNNNKGQGVGSPNDEVCPYGTAGYIYCYEVAASDRTAEQWKVLATKGVGFTHGNNYTYITLPAPKRGGSRREAGASYICPKSKRSGFVNVPGCNNKFHGVGNPNDEVCPYGTAGYIYCFGVAASSRTSEQWKVLATKGAGFIHGNRYKYVTLPAPGRGGRRREAGVYYVCPTNERSGFVTVLGCNNNKGQGVGGSNSEACPYGTAGYIYCYQTTIPKVKPSPDGQTIVDCGVLGFDGICLNLETEVEKMLTSAFCGSGDKFTCELYEGTLKPLVGISKGDLYGFERPELKSCIGDLSGNYLQEDEIADDLGCSNIPVVSSLKYGTVAASFDIIPQMQIKLMQMKLWKTPGDDTVTPSFCVAVTNSDCSDFTFGMTLSGDALATISQVFPSGEGITKGILSILAAAAEAGIDAVTFALSTGNGLEVPLKIYSLDGNKEGHWQEAIMHPNIYFGVGAGILDLPFLDSAFSGTLLEVRADFKRAIDFGNVNAIEDLFSGGFTDLGYSEAIAIEGEMNLNLSLITANLLPDMTMKISAQAYLVGSSDTQKEFDLPPGLYMNAEFTDDGMLEDLVNMICEAFSGALKVVGLPITCPKISINLHAEVGLFIQEEAVGFVIKLGDGLELKCTATSINTSNPKLNCQFLEALFQILWMGVKFVIAEIGKFLDDVGEAIFEFGEAVFEEFGEGFIGFGEDVTEFAESIGEGFNAIDGHFTKPKNRGDICSLGTTCKLCHNGYATFWFSQISTRCGEEDKWSAGSICAIGTSCNNCKDGYYEYWHGKVATACGREPRWADGTYCFAGTSCNRCENGDSWWFGKAGQHCGHEPCWGKGTHCGAGTTCNSCCGSYETNWYWFGFAKCR